MCGSKVSSIYIYQLISSQLERTNYLDKIKRKEKEKERGDKYNHATSPRDTQEKRKTFSSCTHATRRRYA